MDDCTFPQTNRFVDKMTQEGLPQPLIDHFVRQYQRYRSGESGHLRWNAIEPPRPNDVVTLDQISSPDAAAHGVELLDRLVCIKVNGGLGTTMHLDRAKSLIPARGGRSFLQLIGDQITTARRKHRARVPLLLMNSFRTRQDSLVTLSGLSQPEGLPRDFLQHKVPRIDADSHEPASLSDREAQWAPPGHGDIYLALWLTGLLQRLSDEGYRWVFVSNADNLAATVDSDLLGHLDREAIDFAMEVTPKTEADKKGGTLVRHAGRLTLLERAQVEPEHLADFEDISTFAVFNTNSLWWRIDTMIERLRAGALDLPMIVNHKRAEDRDVVQLETAMGAAVGCFERALGVRVSRARFAPVKATNDLLTVRSDAYLVGEHGGLLPNPARSPDLGPPLIDLDADFYASLGDFEQRFAEVPSLVDCRSLKVCGDVRFGGGVVVRGDVSVTNATDCQQEVAAGSILADCATRW